MSIIHLNNIRFNLINISTVIFLFSVNQSTETAEKWNAANLGDNHYIQLILIYSAVRMYNDRKLKI